VWLIKRGTRQLRRLASTLKGNMKSRTDVRKRFLRQGVLDAPAFSGVGTCVRAGGVGGRVGGCVGRDVTRI
jgi:hypothetical protein